MTEFDPMHGPFPSPTWIADKRRRLVADEAKRRREAEAQSLADVVGEYERVAKAMLARYAALPCRGSLHHVTECSDAFAETCAEREEPSCPRQILAFDRKRETEQRLERLKYSGVPEPFLRLLESGISPTQATQAVDAFLARKDKLLVLSGRPGVGKSAAGAYAIWRSQSGRFVPASELARLSSFDDEDRRKLEHWRRCRLLILDDLGMEYADGKGWALAMVDSLVAGRFDDALPTVVTTNLNVGEFAARYGQRIADRIVGGGDFIELGGASMRRRA